MKKSVKKACALAVMLAALVAIYTGIGYMSNFESQVKTRTPFIQETIVVGPMGYGYIRVDINETGEHDICTNLNGTLRTESIPETKYLSWMNGSYKPMFSEEIGPNVFGYGGGAGDVYPIIDAYAEPWYYIYWNTNASASVEVKTEVCRVSTATAYNYSDLGLGVLLIAAGAVSGLRAAVSISKRVLFVVISLVLIASGAVLLVTYSHTSVCEEIVCSKTIVVPASGNITEHIQYNTTDPYLLTLTVDKGTMNTTTMSKGDYADFLQGQHEPYWQKWRFECSQSGQNYELNPTGEAYLLLVNPEATNKTVTIQFHRYWEGYNYVCLVGGVGIFVGGITLFGYVNKRQIAAFNRALDKD